MNLLSVDRQFIDKISGRLEKFKWQRDGSANFRCPVCGDSKKSKTKTRGYLIKGKENYSYYCHNCGHSEGFAKFLKKFDPTLYKEYAVEAFKGKYDNNHRWFHNRLEKQEEVIPEKKKFAKAGVLTTLKSIRELDEFHPAKKYCRKRKIPEKYWDVLFYTDNFKKWINENVSPDKFPGNFGGNQPQTDKRIVIPFYSRNGVPFAYQGRYIGANKDEQRYITINPNPNNVLIYGLERLKAGKQMYACEGPIDSYALDNCVAVAGSALAKLLKIKTLNPVFIFDNEPYSEIICGLMETIIDAGKDIVIWPKNIKQKDLNKCVQDGINVVDLVENNTYNGLVAKIKLNDWKKI